MGVKHNPPLVLVADDEIAAATMLKHIFEREGFQVHLTHDGITALEAAQKMQPDLILLDIQMPTMNGFEVLKRLREHSLTAGISTIVVSARAREPADIAKGLNIGADDYIAKPFAPQELVARAKSKMRSRQLEEALQERSQELEALLRVSEELNHHLSLSELFSLILYLTLDLLATDYALICQFDENNEIASYQSQLKKEMSPENAQRVETSLLANIHKLSEKGIWVDKKHDLGLTYGIAAKLSHGHNQLGVLVAASDEMEFQESHLKLFQGICRQAALALHNAELYEIQANYALHLEDMVTQRTEELKTAQELLFRSEKLASIGHLAASIAHEINNPLQPIRLNLEYIMEDVQANQPIDAELIEMTQNSVERISRIVRQLLEFTKSSDKGTFATVQIKDVIQNIVTFNERSFEREQMQIVCELEDVPEISANRDQLEQVFMNMMLNAKAAMSPKDILTIRLWEEVNKIKIQFADTGSGIPEEIIQKIFDPFISTKPTGTGLGLFVTYGIIERHRGDIEVKSEIGKGTIFTITLPK